jgi:hypothetical protein
MIFPTDSRIESGAIIEGDYRYLLWRKWNSKGKTVSFIMLNPSRADAHVNDPTITRCINFARSWSYGRLEVVNLFAYRTSKPSLLKQATEPIGSDNDRYILESVSKSDRVILAWGNHGRWRKQDLYVLQLLKSYTNLYSLGITKQGCPRHPLYLRSTVEPIICTISVQDSPARLSIPHPSISSAASNLSPLKQIRHHRTCSILSASRYDN